MFFKVLIMTFSSSIIQVNSNTVSVIELLVSSSTTTLSSNCVTASLSINGQERLNGQDEYPRFAYKVTNQHDSIYFSVRSF